MKLLPILSFVIVASTLSTSAPLLAETSTDTVSSGSVANAKETLSDTNITADVKAKFVKEKLFGDSDASAMGIHVETNDGVSSI